MNSAMFPTPARWLSTPLSSIERVGEQLEKFSYGRLGRGTHHFVLASHNDTTYSHALDVAGDIVLEERQTTFDTDEDIAKWSKEWDRTHK